MTNNWHQTQEGLDFIAAACRRVEAIARSARDLAEAVELLRGDAPVAEAE